MGQRSRIRRASVLPLGRKRAVASIKSAILGRRMPRSRRIVPGCSGAVLGARRRSATWESERTWSSMSSVQSVRATGVDAMQTSPFQWLNTMVADSGCHVARRYWSPPRTSGRNTRFGRASATCRVCTLPGSAASVTVGALAGHEMPPVQAPLSLINSVRSPSQGEFSHPSSSPSRFATATAFSTHSIRTSSNGSARPTR
jgi:hypothetical protein